MNRQPSERHIIWSNLSLDVDDWREAYKEFLEANELDADPMMKTDCTSIWSKQTTSTLPMKG